MSTPIEELEVIHELDDDSLSYEFDTYRVYKNPKNGELFYASDSGCSCPTPFEGYRSSDDLTKIDKASYGSFEQDFVSWAERTKQLTEARTALQSVRKHLEQVGV